MQVVQFCLTIRIVHLLIIFSQDYQQKLDDYLSTPKTIDSEGERELGPWDCAGLTGVSCCAMIKHDVRDADTKGNSIQCWIEQAGTDIQNGETVTKKLCEDDITKVCVYENHDGYVDQVPILAYDHVIDAAIADGKTITTQYNGRLRDGSYY